MTIKKEEANRAARYLFEFLAVTVLMLFSVPASAAIIASDRSVVWQGNVGVTGGIPARTTTRDCVALYGAHADGLDTSAQITNCLNGIADGEAAYLPAGTYVVTSGIDIPANKTLRGAGIDTTTIVANADLSYILQIKSNYTSTTGVAITSGYTKGSTQLVLSDAGAISAGDFVYLDELNDATIPVSIVGDGGTCSYCGRFGQAGTRTRLQITKVTGKSGNTIDISPPLFFTFSASNSPQATKTPAYVEYAGIENLTVKNGSGAWTQKRKNISMQGAANSWVKNVKVETCGKRCIDLYFDTYRNEIRDSILTGCYDKYHSDTCYGVEIDAGSSNLIENNLFNGTANGIVLVSASGNVFGYNYFIDVYRTVNSTSWFWSDSFTHGSHNAMNLWEGNIGAGINFDNYWGSNSHNTLFRNRFYGKAENITYDAYHRQVAAVTTAKNNRHMNVVGNVLGTPDFSDIYERTSAAWLDNAIYGTGSGTDPEVFNTMLRHLNFDYVNNGTKKCGDAGEPGCQGGDQSNILPDSLYLTAKPGFYYCRSWPSIGSDLTVKTGPLPAKDRYDLTDPCSSSNIPNPPMDILPTP